MGEHIDSWRRGYLAALRVALDLIWAELKESERKFDAEDKDDAKTR